MLRAVDARVAAEAEVAVALLRQQAMMIDEDAVEAAGEAERRQPSMRTSDPRIEFRFDGMVCFVSRLSLCTVSTSSLFQFPTANYNIPDILTPGAPRESREIRT